MKKDPNEDLINSLSTIKDLWLRYRGLYSVKDTENNILQSLKITIRMQFKNGMAVDVEMNKTGVYVYDGSRTAIFMAEFIDEDCNLYCSYDIESGDIEMFADEPILLRFTKSWNEDYIIYQNGGFLNSDEEPIDNIEEMAFQSSTVNDDALSYQEILDTVNGYDKIQATMKENGICYLTVLDKLFYDELCSYLNCILTED